MNPLVNVVKILQKGMWYDFADLAVVVGYQMKLAGVDYRTNDQLAAICVELKMSGFIEHHPEDITKVRVCEVWYESI